MLEGKAVVRETDMPEALQSHGMELAYQALDLHEVSDCQSIAHFIKQVFFFSLLESFSDYTNFHKQQLMLRKEQDNFNP